MPRPIKFKEEERKLAWAIANPERKQLEPTKVKPFNRADSLSIVALLVGVYLVVVVPPLALKVVILIAICIGVFLFFLRSHWTHSWSKLKQRTVSGIVIVLLLAVGIPQFISQWRYEHSRRPMVQDHPVVLIEKGGKWLSNSDTVYAPNGTAIENKGEINSKDLRVNPPNPRDKVSH